MEGFPRGRGSCSGPAGGGAPTRRRFSTSAPTGRTARGSPRARPNWWRGGGTRRGWGGGSGGGGRGAGGDVRPAVSEPRDDARGGEIRARQPPEPRSASRDRGDRDRRAPQAGRREREPASGPRSRPSLTESAYASSATVWPASRPP